MVQFKHALAIGIGATLLIGAGGGMGGSNSDPHGHHCRKGEFTKRIKRNGMWRVICVPGLKPAGSEAPKRNGDPHQVVHPVTVKTVVQQPHH